MEWFSAITTVLLTLMTSLGVFKYLVEPRLRDDLSRLKYATPLWKVCSELLDQINEIQDSLRKNDKDIRDALKKIPNNDFGGRIDWFTKTGYYTTITAYKIASVFAWSNIYQHELLLSPYSKNRRFFEQLYQKSENLKIAFSDDTIFWRYYCDSLGDKIVEEKSNLFFPISFAVFCERYFSDHDFRLFFEQLHMFLWHVADGKYLSKLDNIELALRDMQKMLKKEKLLKGLEVKRSHTRIADQKPLEERMEKAKLAT